MILIEQLDAIRNRPKRRAIVISLCYGIGLGLASVHWLGLIAGGALVALPNRRLLTGIAAGFVFGLLVIIVWFLLHWHAGMIGSIVGMGEFTGIAVAVAIGLPLLGSLVRGIVQ